MQIFTRETIRNINLDEFDARVATPAEIVFNGATYTGRLRRRNDVLAFHADDRSIHLIPNLGFLPLISYRHYNNGIPHALEEIRIG